MSAGSSTMRVRSRLTSQIQAVDEEESENDASDKLNIDKLELVGIVFLLGTNLVVRSDFQSINDWDKVHREQINATRLLKQLKALLSEMDVLRGQVQNSDLDKFDKLTSSARDSAAKAIDEYLALNPQKMSPIWISPRQEPTFSENRQDDDSEEQAGMVNSVSKEELEKQQACLQSWDNLQAEVKDVHELFQDFDRVVQEQKQKVNEVDTNVEQALENVTEGTKMLSLAAKHKTAIYPLAGAIIGGCIGGPIGLVAGLKLGGLAAIGCGALGFTGGHILRKRENCSEQRIELTSFQQSCNLKGSLSLPYIADSPTVAAKKDM
uniref:t-SNARE coiled-coil homology domain-containing protein n=1 Tax=Timema monikensis TaxID=170555 RepID=A0A7R9HNW7_9NEOP|nr:unnamed protein product [Timema monikensis]